MRAGHLALMALGLSGCLSQVEEFTDGRLETLCDGAIPICAVRAGCVLDASTYAHGRFPGASQAIVHSELDGMELKIRVLFTELIYPGTELLVQVHGLGCSGLDHEALVDVDIFRRAGDDRILDFRLPLEEKGDHLVEIFSDMSAAFVITAEAVPR